MILFNTVPQLYNHHLAKFDPKLDVSSSTATTFRPYGWSNVLLLQLFTGIVLWSFNSPR